MSGLIKCYSCVIAEHRNWLKSFDNQYSKKWEDLLNNNAESAICEACTRKLLSDHGCMVKTNEDLSSGGPDFRCSKNNIVFYVEATCITIDNVTRKTNLLPSPKINSEPVWYKMLTDGIRNEVSNKTTQCANLNFPCVLAIGTLHYMGGWICLGKDAVEFLLTGTPYIAWSPVSEKGMGNSEDHNTTDLSNSSFVKPDIKENCLIGHARAPISSILLCNFASVPPKVVGALHPKPNRKFDRLLLSDIEFARLVEGYQNGNLQVEWI